MMRLRSDLSRLMFDPEILDDETLIPRDHPAYLCSFDFAGHTWHAFKAYPSERIKGWTLYAGHPYHGTSDSLDDFLSDPDTFAENRDSWVVRGRPGWAYPENVQEYPDLDRVVTVKFISDSQWAESGIEDPL